MKKIIYVFGVIFLVTVILLSLVFTAHLDNKEHIIVRWNNILYMIGAILLGVLLFLVTKKIDVSLKCEEMKKKRKIILIIACVIYLLLNILWVSMVRPKVKADQLYSCNLAQTIYRGDLEEFLPNKTYLGFTLAQYAQCYPQQLTLAFVFHICFKIFHTDCYVVVLRLINIVCNCLIVYALYKISQQISKKYEINKVLLLTLSFTFFPLIMLSTFIYGDVPGLVLGLFSVYFIMKYIETKKWKYAIIASILMMIAYMMRMNSLIFVIAIVIYLMLNLWKDRKNASWKEKGLRAFVIVAFVAISIFPTKLVSNYYMDKFGLEKGKSFPVSNYLLMAMEEGSRAEGWYNGKIAKYALENPKKAKEEYPEKIKERLKYFSQNLGYTAKFYTRKITSTWAENTYSALFNNASNETRQIEKLRKPLEFYQKAILLVITVCSLIVMIQNRKNLSLEVLLLITIFIGGFAFHILWETKSRYIIPYVIVLIPVASIGLKKHFLNKSM